MALAHRQSHPTQWHTHAEAVGPQAEADRRTGSAGTVARANAHGRATACLRGTHARRHTHAHAADARMHAGTSRSADQGSSLADGPLGGRIRV